MRRLDAFAKGRGLNRSQAIRAAVLEASPAALGELPAVADRDELLRLLGEAARGGSVSAMRALLAELREPPGEDPQEAFIDRLAREARERHANGHAAGRG